VAFSIWDPFQGVAAGSGTPAGWSGPSFGSGTVELFSSGGAFSPHQWFDFTGQNLLTPTITPAASFTVWFAFNHQGYVNNGIVLLGNCQPAPPTMNDISAFGLVFEDDSTLSLYVGSIPSGGSVFSPNLMGNTGSVGATYPAGSGIWYFIQVNITLSLTMVSGVNRLTATGDVFVDGVRVLNGVSAISNTLIDADFLASSPLIHQFAWNQPNGSGPSGLGEVYVGPNVGSGVLAFPGNLWDFTVVGGSGYNPPTTTVTVSAGDATLTPVITGGVVTGILPTAPNQLGDSYGSAPTLTITDSSGDGSGASATAFLAPTPFRRAPQDPMEVGALPSNADIRSPQMVIEVATLAGSPPPPPVNPTTSGPTGGAGRFIFTPAFRMIPPPGKPRYKGCGRKPDCFAVPEREWVDQTYGTIVFNPQGAIPLPSPATGDTVIFSFLVPIGYDGMILGQYNIVTSTFTQGSGDIVWRIAAAGRYLKDRGDIVVSIGTNRRLYPVPGGLQLRSGNLVQFICNAQNTGGSLPPPGTAFVLAGLHGVFWPRK
jgi:hypothetical protein